jgi:hypothetical protein
LTPGQRSQLAAEDGAATLNRLLRRVENAKAVLNARQISKVIQHCIRETVSLELAGDRCPDCVRRPARAGRRRPMSITARQSVSAAEALVCAWQGRLADSVRDPRTQESGAFPCRVPAGTAARLRLGCLLARGLDGGSLPGWRRLGRFLAGARLSGGAR